MGIDVVVDLVGPIDHKCVHPFRLERLSDEGGSLRSGNEENERDAGVPVGVIDTAELDTQLTGEAGNPILDLSLAPSHIVQQLVQSAQLDEGNGALQLRLEKLRALD